MASMRILFRASSKGSLHKGHLYLRLTHNRKSKFFGLKLHVFPTEWDDGESKIIASLADNNRYIQLQEISKQLDHTSYLMEKAIEKIAQKGKYQLSDIIDAFKLSETKNSFSQFVQILSRDLLKQNRPRTSRAYESVRNRILKFNEERDFPLNMLTNSFVSDFEEHLKMEHLSLNTISFYMRNLRAIYNKAIESKYIVAKTDNPFQNVYTGVQVTRKRAMSKDEINTLHSLDLNQLSEEKSPEMIDKLTVAKDLFFFCFHAQGMSFIDMAHLRKEDLRGGYITYYRKKTRQQIEIRITPILNTIIKKYADQTAHSKYIFPIISNISQLETLQYQNGLNVQNKRLKVLAKLAGIEKNLSTHVARHSWASIAKGENLPIWVISEGLGHSSVKTTYIYLASFDRSRIDDASWRVSKAISS